MGILMDTLECFNCCLLVIEQQMYIDLFVFLSGKELELKHREREADDALGSMKDAKRSKEQKEADKLNADVKLDKKRDELKAAQIVSGVTAGVSIVASIFTFGLGAGPGSKFMMDTVTSFYSQNKWSYFLSLSLHLFGRQFCLFQYIYKKHQLV